VSDTSSTDVVVVGAGPAGSAMAIRLAGAGLGVTLIDRAAFPRPKPCSEFMSPETVRHLHLLGVLPAVEAAGARPLPGAIVFGPRGSTLTGIFALAGHAPFRPNGISLERTILDEILVRAASRAGAAVEERTTAVELLYDRGHVAGIVAQDREGRIRSIRARLTVGADGLRSLVARRLGRRRNGVPSRLAFVAHVEGVSELGDLAEIHVGSAGYVGLNALQHNLSNVGLVVPRAVAQDARGRAERFFFDRLETFPGVRGRVPSSGLRDAVQVTGPFSARSGRVVAAGTLLVGDAAEFFDPITGDGICTALRGAELAAQIAVEALARPGLVTADRLSGYPTARRAAFAGKWVLERMIGFGQLIPSLLDRVVARVERRGWGHTMAGVAGHFVPAREVLNPRVLFGMLV
jgi:flavin-dependent dehydrogenase